MKFGKTLQTLQHPEWSRNYIAYKHLKHLIKNILSLKQEDEITFFYTLEREINKVNGFFNYKIQMLERRCNIFTEKLRIITQVDSNTIDTNAVKPFLEGISDLERSIHTLMKFAQVNKTGFTKILKKYDKKLQRSTKDDYIKTKILPLPFATPTLLDHLSEQVAALKKNLGPVKLSTPKLQHVTEAQHRALIDAFENDSVQLLRTLPTPPNLNSALYTAARNNAYQCLDYLVSIGASPNVPDDINERTLIHDIILSGGSVYDGNTFHDECKLLDILLPASKLDMQDIFGRRPLHYAAILGYHNMARAIIAEERKQGVAEGVDVEGYSPLFYAVLKGHTETVRVMVETFGTEGYREENSVNAPMHTHIAYFASTVNTPLTMACKYGYADIVSILMDKGALVSTVDEDGETALHLAVRSGNPKIVEMLITHPDIDLNKQERVGGLTPLAIAAMEGQKAIITSLLAAHADVTIKDRSSWTPHEHAVFRGHLPCAEMLRHDCSTPSIYPKTPANPGLISRPQSPSASAKAYGHRTLNQGECLVVLTLGTNDSRKSIKAFTIEDTIAPTLSCVITLSSSNSDPITIDLPAKDILEPITFSVNSLPALLKFDFKPTFGTGKLATGYHFVNQPCARDIIIPIISLDGRLIGSIRCEWMIISPFEHSKAVINARRTYWKATSTAVIGHRGAGANSRDKTLQVGENTVMSMVTAASLGAEYVEFDVQLTRDLIPVIYHDWEFTESGLKVPVSALYANDFKHYGDNYKVKLPRDKTDRSEVQRPETPLLPEDKLSTETPPIKKKTGRRNSFTEGNVSKEAGNIDAPQRGSYTGGRGDGAIKGEFSTLRETLKQVPKHIGFNIELKYPSLKEIEEFNLPEQDVNVFVDAVLKAVYDLAGDRNIIFSSFQPDACLCINLKQPNYPVFFLTEAGTEPTSDIRCNSLQESVRFARLANLLGVVTDSRPLLEAPRLIRTIKESGLLLFSYGHMNNDVKAVELQVREGVNAVIVDKVLAVAKSMRPKTAARNTESPDVEAAVAALII